MSQMNKIKRKRMRARLHADDPHCRFCGRVTRLIENPRPSRQPPDMAVLIHLYTREMPERCDRGQNSGIRLSELVCWACANDYGNGVHCMQPLEVRRAKSGRYPQEARAGA